MDGILYLKVLEPQRASYGITDYSFAMTQLAQTTLRSEIGKIELDRTFEERTNINVVAELDKASDPWGVKVLRYEIKNITPPKGVLDGMEKQMRAEREKRAVILTSEGERDAKINQAEGEQQVIKASEAKKQQQINEAEGQARQSWRLPRPPQRGCARWPARSASPAAPRPCSLRVAEDYLIQFGNLAKQGNTLVVPANLSDIASMITLATTVLRQDRPANTPPALSKYLNAFRQPAQKGSPTILARSWNVCRYPRCRIHLRKCTVLPADQEDFVHVPGFNHARNE